MQQFLSVQIDMTL